MPLLSVDARATPGPFEAIDPPVHGNPPPPSRDRAPGLNRLRWPLISLLWAIAFLTAWFAMTLIFAETERVPQVAYNSDLIAPFMVVRDLLRDPAELHHWYLSPANFAFPDWPLAAMLLLSPLPRMILPIVYGGGLLAAYGFLIGWLLVEMRTARRAEATLWGTTLIALLMMASNANPNGFSGVFVRFICAAATHSGAVVCGVALIAMLARVFNGDGLGQRIATGATVVLVAVACFSDRAFALWYAGPVCLSYLVSRTRMKFPRKLLTVAGLAGVGVAAVALDHLRPTSRLGGTFDWNARESLEVFAKLFRESLGEGQWQLWLPVCLLVPMFVRGIWLVGTPRARRHATRDSVELAVICATLSSVALPIALNALYHPSLLRYLLPMFLLPYVWLLMFASRWSTQGMRPWLYAAPLAFWAYSATLAPQGFAAVAAIKDGDTLAKYLLSIGQTAGYGDYWTAKKTMYESNYAVHCLQLHTGELKPLLYIYNGTWYGRRADNRGRVRPTFVVVTRLDEKLLRQNFGEPDDVKKFGWEEIWIYDEPLPLPVQQRAPEGE